MTVYAGGWQFADDGVVQSIAVADGEALPSGTVIVGGIAHHPDGRVYVAPWPAAGDVFYIGSLAVRSDGALLFDTAGVITNYWGGIALTYRGEIVATASSPAFYRFGFGVLGTGEMCLSDTGGGGGGGHAASILLEDGSYLLQEDGSSSFLLE